MKDIIPLLFVLLLIISCTIFGLWKWSLRIDYCQQNSNLSWTQCAIMTMESGNKK